MDNSCFGHGRPNGQGAEAPIPSNAGLGGRVPKGAPIKIREFTFTHTSGCVPRHTVLGLSN